jgi:centrosomal protein CEP104
MYTLAWHFTTASGLNPRLVGCGTPSTAVHFADEFCGVVTWLNRSEVSRNTAAPLFDSTIGQLVEKLADGNGRLREAGRKGLELMAASSHIGPAAVAGHCARALPPKQKTLWRPIAARIQMLTDLVNAYGLGGSSGLSVDMVLGFPKNHQAYAHSAAEVRVEAKKLVGAVHRIAGPAGVDSTLKLLRPKQLEEYQAAFESASGDQPTPMPGPSAAAGPKGGSTRDNAGAKGLAPLTSPARVDKHLQHATHTPGGKVPTSASKAQQHHDAKHSGGGGAGAKGGHDDGGDEVQDFTTCMFCQIHDKTWNENDLDVHYWKDCPLLISCPSCAQIVEIAGLPEHLLDECDEKDQYVPCDVTGMNQLTITTVLNAVSMGVRGLHLSS